MIPLQKLTSGTPIATPEGDFSVVFDMFKLASLDIRMVDIEQVLCTSYNVTWKSMNSVLLRPLQRFAQASSTVPTCPPALIELNKCLEESIPVPAQNRLKEHWYLIAKGSAYRELASRPYVDFPHTTTTNIKEVREVLGIEAAYRAIKKELMYIEKEGATSEFISLIASVITCRNNLTPMTPLGLGERNAGSSISEVLTTQDAVSKVIRFSSGGHRDDLHGINGCVINGKIPMIGHNVDAFKTKREYARHLVGLI